jgi:CheY-like chemotaxis protein
MPDRKVLVVDDELNARLMMTVFLSGLNCQVLEAANGEDALAIARLHRPAVIILDLQMPGMDGFETFSQIARIPELEDTHVIILTGICEMTGQIWNSKDVLLRSGREPAAFLEKPVQMTLLRETIQQLLAD